MIQFVILMGVLSMALTVGHDVFDDAPESTTASTSGAAEDAPALPGAPTVVPPANGTQSEANGTDADAWAAVVALTLA